MGSYEDVNLATFEFFEQFLRLFRGAGPGEIIHLYGHILQPLGECLEVLQGKHCCRHQHSHLLAVVGGFEGSTDSNFRLTKSYIAADKPVHRTSLLHILLHLLCRLHLVGGVFVKERPFQFVLQVSVGRECKALLVTTFCVELYEVSGNVFYSCLRAFLDAFPSPCTEGTETWWLTCVRTSVFAYLI